MSNYKENERQIYETGLKFVPKRNFAIDIGACEGLWTNWMADDFENVIAFEPIPQNREILREKCLYLNNVDILPVSLYNEDTIIKLHNSVKKLDSPSGHWQISKPNVEYSSIEVVAHTLDGYYFPSPDYIKIDVEGAALEVLEGATETLTKFSPILNIEVIFNGKYDKKIMEYLAQLNYFIGKKIGKHEIFIKNSY